MLSTWENRPKIPHLKILKIACVQTLRRQHAWKNAQDDVIRLSSKQQDFISPLSGSWKIQDQGSADLGSGEALFKNIISVKLHMVQDAPRLLGGGVSFVRALISIMK